jgi:cell division protease FtsH
VQSNSYFKKFLALILEAGLLIILITPNSKHLRNLLGTIIKPAYITPANACILVMVLITVWVIAMGIIERKGLDIYNILHKSDVTNGKTRFKMAFAKEKEKDKTRPLAFSEVAGLEEPKRELGEVLEFLHNPQKFICLGARIPRGIIMYGPPGTGKTLLARALAREAQVEFIAASGSEFVEKYVGMGASRVRELFARARHNKNGAIIFIDEIDSLGRKREGGENSIEKDQTLNQLLIEMDGFNSRQDPVIVIGSTNRLDILDPALLRPGRFDRHIAIGYPSFRERCAILKMHMRNKPMPDVSLESFAYKTSGMTGADLENICNEAALIAARKGKSFISEEDVDEAIDRIIAGIENKSYIPSEKEKRLVAYHEAGHALAGIILGGEPVRRISILPRGNALGFTLQSEESDKRLYTRQDILNKITVLMAGRAAEELVFSEITSGSANDIEKSTNMAYKMIAELGMTDNHISNMSYVAGSEPMIIYNEVENIIRDCLLQATNILKDNIAELTRIAEDLLAKESLNEEDIKLLLAF